MPMFLDGQDPLDATQGIAQRAPLGQAAPDPFQGAPTLGDTAAAAFRQNNPVVSVIEGIGAKGPDHNLDPSYNPMTVLKGTPYEQDPSRFVDDPNESVTQARIAQIEQEKTDRDTLARSGTTGVVAALGAGLLDPSFYLPIIGEAHGVEAAAGFARSVGRMASVGALQSGVSEAALAASQQDRSWKESAGNIATNTLLMGLMGGALGTLARGEQAEAVEAMESVRRDATPVNPLDPSSMSLQEHITPGASGFSQGVEARATELHAAGAAQTPIEALEAAHIEALPKEIADEVDGGAAQAGLRDATERGGAGAEPDPEGALGKPSSGWGADGGGDVVPAGDGPAASADLAASGGLSDLPALLDQGAQDAAASTRASNAWLDSAAEDVRPSLEADPKWKGAWDEDRVWKHIRDVFPEMDDGGVAQVAERIEKQTSTPSVPEIPEKYAPGQVNFDTIPDHAQSVATGELAAEDWRRKRPDLRYDRGYVKDGDLVHAVIDNVRRDDGRPLSSVELRRAQARISAFEYGHLEDYASGLADTERFEALSPEAQDAEIAADRARESDERRGYENEMLQTVDRALADGWRPTEPQRRDGFVSTRDAPPEVQAYGSPKSLRTITDHLRARGALSEGAPDAAARMGQDRTVRNPTTGATAEALETGTLRDMLHRFDVSGDTGLDPLARANGMALGRVLRDLVGDVRVNIVTPEQMRVIAAGRLRIRDGEMVEAFYDSRTHQISILDDFRDNPAEAQRILLHEGLHAALMRTINGSSAASAAMARLHSAVAELHLRRGGALSDHYGLSSVHEFVSEAGSNPEFQRFLASMSADARLAEAFGLGRTPGYNLWDVFVAGVRKILGLAPEQHTMLDAALRGTQDLFTERARGVTGEARPGAAASLRPGGAAPSDTRDLELKSFGLEKVPGLGELNAKLSPNLRIYSGPSTQAKRAAADLAETALRFTMHDRGVATSAGGPLESAVRVDKAKFQTAAHEALEQAWIQHRYGDTAPTHVQRASDAIGDLRGQTPAGKMTYKQFKDAVHDAMTAGDEHPVPEVAQAAREVRAKVFDPIAKRAQETLGPDGRPMLGEELAPPKGDQSFVPRMWNHEAVIAKRFQLKSIITDWLGGEQATKAAARDRISGFVDDLRASTERLGAMAEDDPARAHEQATHDAIRGKIEKEIADWQGSSSAEARAALAAREKAETARQAKIDEGSYRGARERLTSADDAVDAATRRILASDRDLSRAELGDRADEIIDRIIGSPDGRIPYDAASGGPRVGYTGGPKNEVRGALRSRDFAIPTSLVRDFVQRDMEHVTSSYLRTILPDIALTRRFGDVDMTDTFRRIQEEYARMIGPETTEKQAREINARRDSDITDVAALRDRLRGVYGWNPDPTARKLASIVRDFHAATSLASLGTSVANRLNDIGAQAVMRYGLSNVAHDAWRPFLKSMLGMSPLAGIAKQQAKEMGVGIDGLLGHLRHNLSDINDNYLPGNKFSRGLAWANDRSMLVNLHGPWTDYMKAMAWVPAQAELGRIADRVAAGTQNAKDLSRLADANIAPEMARRISAEIQAHSVTVDGVRLASTGEWTDLAAREAFERAMSREANINVITAGIGDKPLFLSKPIGGLVGQFKSFVAGSHERILLSNLQQRDGRTMQGMLVAMAMGMLSYRLYTLLSGQEASPRPQDWVKEGLARSALTGWFNEANNTLAKFTAGKVDYNRLYGADRPLTRRTENSPLSELLGPTYSQLEGLTGIATHTLGGHASAADVHALRHIAPLQNLMGARILFDDAEDGVDNALGFKPRNHSPHEWAPGPTPYPS